MRVTIFRVVATTSVIAAVLVAALMRFSPIVAAGAGGELGSTRSELKLGREPERLTSPHEPCVDDDAASPDVVSHVEIDPGPEGWTQLRTANQSTRDGLGCVLPR
jgi:hypothetical protein